MVCATRQWMASLVTQEYSLIDELLREQNELSAVDRFSQRYTDYQGPAQQQHYKDLLPIRKPSTGEQYSFEVDLDTCTGCKACVTACHSLNGLHNQEAWRDVGFVRGVENGEVHQQTVTSACHHCADPACLSGCPVEAYEKLDNGIVKHLDDQCIGCQYCSLKCPYDVPKYDKSLGIVRKCDMCHERLAEGEAPACVQACPNGAISIKVVSVDTVKERASGGKSMIAGAFRSDYTLPSTNFKSKKALPASMEAADARSLEPSHQHSPLVWMLTLTQLAVGVTLANAVVSLLLPELNQKIEFFMLLVAAVLGGIGLAASVLHLGSPLGAWRVFLGLRTSWLSREVVTFGAWMPLLLLHAVLVSPLPSVLGLADIVSIETLSLLTRWGLVTVGLAAVFTSVMVYVDTRREFWKMGLTGAKFFGSVLLGGVTSLASVAAISGEWRNEMAVAVLIASFLKLIAEWRGVRPAFNEEWSLAKQSGLIQWHTLGSIFSARIGLLVLGVLCISLGMVQPYFTAFGAFVIVLGEVWERRLFFQSVVTLKMPGSLKS